MLSGLAPGARAVFRKDTWKRHGRSNELNTRFHHPQALENITGWSYLRYYAIAIIIPSSFHIVKVLGKPGRVLFFAHLYMRYLGTYIRDSASDGGVEEPIDHLCWSKISLPI